MLSSGRFTINAIHNICKRYAGHSKWQNIRHTKAAKDTEKALMYIKLGQKIKIAIQETGISETALNTKLSQAVEIAKSKHMPASTIQSYINQAVKSGTNGKVLWFEIKGPKGLFFIVQAFSDNPKRTRDLITNILKKSPILTLVSNLKNQFIHRGVILALPKSETKNCADLSVEHAIESGAEDVELEENKLKFYCHPDHVKKVADNLSKLGYEIEDADDHYLPITTVSLDDDLVDDLSKPIEKISNLPEIVKIFDNIA